ncbi:MAG: hypothetical protein EXS67_00755 [Candidatus Margulisbacteria bacterium]|nr:hypothetical protein [Candidatus Margulisiibacteriota bacterium]
MTTHKPIQFGTSGHRGIIGDSFTIAQVIAIAHAVADMLLKTKSPPKLIVGYDPRTGNDPKRSDGSFTHAVTETLASRGVQVFFCETYTATPVISWAIQHLKLDGGLILTASHNPPEYNGIKFNPANGAPAPSDVTNRLQARANQHLNHPAAQINHKLPIQIITPMANFAKTLLQNLSTFNSTPNRQISVTIDAKHGTAASVWKELLPHLPIITSHIFHEDPRSDFGNIPTNPTDYAQLTELRSAHTDISIAHDPDSDRHAILDEKGDPVSPEEICVLLAEYALQKGLPLTKLVTTLASSGLIKAVAKKHQLTYTETPVGFKYIAPELEKARNNNQIAFGVESSGGFSASFHTLEKCGFLPAVMLILYLSEITTPLSELRNSLYSRYGNRHFCETTHPFNPSHKEKIITSCQTATSESLQPFFSQPIESLDQRDGLKIIFSSSDWVLIRLSGTEPIARIYAESGEEIINAKLIKELQNWISG